VDIGGRWSVNCEENSKEQFPQNATVWVLYRAERQKRSLARRLNVRYIQYKGKVWCFEAPPNKMFITRRNGCPLIAGNTAMEGPVLRQWSRYQTFWAAQFRRMVRIVLWAASIYSQSNEFQIDVPDKFADVEVTVSTDKLVEVDLEIISQAMSAMLRDGLLPYVQTGMINTEMAQGILTSVWRMVLEALGTSDVVDIIPAEVESGESIQQSPTQGELQAASSLIGVMKGWDARMDMLEGELRETHIVPEEVNITCPFPGCGGQVAYRYPGHPPNLLVCATCERTFDSNTEYHKSE